MQTTKPVLDVQTVHLQARERGNRSPSAATTIYDTTPETVIALTKLAAAHGELHERLIRFGLDSGNPDLVEAAKLLRQRLTRKPLHS